MGGLCSGKQRAHDTDDDERYARRMQQQEVNRARQQQQQPLTTGGKKVKTFHGTGQTLGGSPEPAVDKRQAQLEAAEKRRSMAATRGIADPKKAQEHKDENTKRQLIGSIQALEKIKGKEGTLQLGLMKIPQLRDHLDKLRNEEVKGDVSLWLTNHFSAVCAIVVLNFILRIAGFEKDLKCRIKIFQSFSNHLI